MSKKLYSTTKWKEYIKSRQRAADKSAKRQKQRKGKHFKVRRVVPASRRTFYTAIAPANFSIVNNPESAIDFLNNLVFRSEKHNLTLDLSRVNSLTTDAIAVLVATLHELQNVTYIRGNLPSDAAAQEILVGSGFFAHVRRMQQLPSVSHGQISQQKSKKVQPDLAKELIHFGTKALGTEQKSTAAYSVLIECMSNTHNHAAKHKNHRELWWAMVYADAARNRVCFTFVDTGVGIFKSVRIGTLRTLYRALGIKDDADILREMLHGNVESSTGFAYRGKGLPAIYKKSQLGRIRSLVIVANDVFCNVPANEFRMLGRAFSGTLLYWEIEIA